MKQITQKITALLDAPHHRQTGFQDPASISMEGILVFNKHLTFLLIVLVLFVGWFLACLVYYFVEFNNHYNSKSAFNKNNKKKAVLSEEVICLWLFVFVMAVPFIFYGELFQIPITRLDPVEAFQEKSGGSDPGYNSEPKKLLSFLENGWLKITAKCLAEDMAAKGHSKNLIIDILLDEVGPSFWWLEYSQQIYVLERRLGVIHPEPSEMSLSIKRSTWLLTTAKQLQRELSAKGYSRERIITILQNKGDDSFRSLEYSQQLDQLEDYLITEEAWSGFYRTIGAVAVCGITAVVVAVVWWYS